MRRVFGVGVRVGISVCRNVQFGYRRVVYVMVYGVCVAYIVGPGCLWGVWVYVDVLLGVCVAIAQGCRVKRCM